MTDRVAVVTGASGLIGREIVLALRGSGVEVEAWDRQEQPSVRAVDVSDPEAVAEAMGEVERRRGHLDVVVHAAALTGRTAQRDIVAALADIELDLWDETLRTNLTAGLVCVKAAVPLLRRSANPAVVLIGSIQGLVPTFETGAYSVSKSAVVGLGRQLAAELAADGITVNVVAPGPTVADDDPGVRHRNQDGAPTPLGRLGGASEVAAVVAAVVGPGFRNVTGAVIPVDGGEHLRPRGAPPGLSVAPSIPAHEEPPA